MSESQKNKVVVFGDLHFGIRGDSVIFQNYQRKIATEVIFPYLEEHKNEIAQLVFLGDIFDRRKVINISTLQFAKWFFNNLRDFNIDIIVGNHDVYYRNTNNINSPTLIFEEYKNITVHDYIAFDKDGFLFVPWINIENIEQIMESIKASQSKVLFGHLEINNALLIGTQRCDFGMDMETFSKFDLVMTGHFHRRQQFGNILYTGCLWELTRDDSFQEKGFYVLTMGDDYALKDIKFIPTTDRFKIFNSVHYDEHILQKLPKTNTPVVDLILPDSRREELRDTYVKVYFESNRNQILWTAFLEKLNSFNPAEVSFQEVTSKEDDEESDNFVIKVENNDMLEVIHTYITDSIHDKKRQEDLFSLFAELYKEASQMEI